MACEPAPELASTQLCAKQLYPTVPALGVAGSAYALLAADFNGDSIRDVAAIVQQGCDVYSTHMVSIFLGEGGGRFGVRTDVTVTNAWSLATGDFDGDGDLDLVAGGDVLLGNGSGGFQVASDSANEIHGVVGDVNNDTKLDLVTYDYVAYRMLLRLGNGNGTFQSATILSAALSPDDMGLVDLNTDGNLDLVALDAATTAGGVLLGNGNGTFQTQASYDATRLVGDVDNDGKLDLYGVRADFNTSTLYFRWRKGVGDGTFQTATESSLSQYGWPRIADFDGDAKNDLLLMNETYSSLLRGNGNGTFQSPEYFGASTKGVILIADLTGDSKLDLAAPKGGCARGSIPIAVNTGAEFKLETRYPQPWVAATPTRLVVDDPFFAQGALTVADVNKDAIPDAIVGTAAGAVSVRLGQTGGSFGPSIDYTVGQPGLVAVVAGDVDLDGAVDVVASAYEAGSGRIVLLRGSGAGSFESPRVLSLVPDTMPRKLALADLDRDGRLDIVGTTGNGPASTLFVVMLNNSTTGLFPHLTRYAPPQGKPSFPLDLVVDDVDGDCHADVLMVDGARALLLVYRGSRDGTLLGPDEYLYEEPTTTGEVGSAFLDVGDVDSDGDVDVVVASGARLDRQYTGHVTLLRNEQGGFSTRTMLTLYTAPDDLALGDLDGDQHLDLVVSNYAAGTVAVFGGHGDGSFDRAVHFGAGQSPFGLALADLDRNGVLDIITAGFDLSTLLAGCE